MRCTFTEVIQSNVLELLYFLEDELLLVDFDDERAVALAPLRESEFA